MAVDDAAYVPRAIVVITYSGASYDHGRPRGKPRQRIKALETVNGELLARVNALENRLLELEAERAIDIDHVEQ